jgi:predicted enzyme related to lactoylglutathione lyase
MGRVIHFEINTVDTRRAAEFYSRVLGWQVQTWEGPMEYLLCLPRRWEHPRQPNC